jgi:hypothetical protein
MKVPTIGPAAGTTATQKARRAGPAGGSRFLDHLDKSGEPELDAAPPVAGIAAAAMVLAAQEVGEEAEQGARRQLARRGEDILDRLDEIRRDILLGAVPRERLESLAQALRSRRAQVTDPRLIAILDDIELRAAVEIAKLTRNL